MTRLEQEKRADERALLKARTFCAAWMAVEPYRKQRAGSKTQLRVEDKKIRMSVLQAHWFTLPLATVHTKHTSP